MPELKSTLIFLVICIICHLTVVASDPSVASAAWTSAVDAAMTELAQDTTFQKQVTSLGVPFVVPYCKETANYPTKNPLPSNITKLTICSELQTSSTNLWSTVYKLVAKGLVANLNKKYSLSLGIEYLSINTTSGYFPSLLGGINSGACDIVVSDTALSTARSEQVSFTTCSYGTTYFTFMRTDLDNTTITGITTLDQLNRADVKVAWWKGTLFDQVMNNSLSLVQKYPGSTMNAMFSFAETKQVHAILFDAIDVYSWMNDHKECVNCYMKVFGDPLPVSIFTKKMPATSGVESIGVLSYGLLICILIIYSIL